MATMPAPLNARDAMPDGGRLSIETSGRHTTTARPLDDMSALRVWERMLGLPCVNGACSATGMAAPFHL